MKDDALTRYQAIREEWHRTVIRGVAADQAIKNAQFDTLDRLWKRMKPKERAEAGAWAKAAFHAAER